MQNIAISCYTDKCGPLFSNRSPRPLVTCNLFTKNRCSDFTCCPRTQMKF